jgi:hypothetical protein
MFIYFVQYASRVDISRCIFVFGYFTIDLSVAEVTHAQFLPLTSSSHNRTNVAGVDMHFRSVSFQIVMQK